jgi:hypothetical protein
VGDGKFNKEREITQGVQVSGPVFVDSTKRRQSRVPETMVSDKRRGKRVDDPGS